MTTKTKHKTEISHQIGNSFESSKPNVHHILEKFALGILCPDSAKEGKCIQEHIDCITKRILQELSVSLSLRLSDDCEEKENYEKNWGGAINS